MIETIKASGSENGFLKNGLDYQASVNTQQVKFAKLNQVLGIIPSMVNQLTDIVILVLGVYLAINGTFTLGMIMAFQGFLFSFTTPAMQLIQSGQTLQEMRTEMERIDDVMNYPADINYDDDSLSPDIEYNKLSGQIELKNVTFGYSRLSEPLIENFNLSLKPGSRVAFVGSSGCGKSTLAKLSPDYISPGAAKSCLMESQ